MGPEALPLGAPDRALSGKHPLWARPGLWGPEALVPESLEDTLGPAQCEAGVQCWWRECYWGPGGHGGEEGGQPRRGAAV